jgi:rhodanese-related sulfurtransferase
MSSAPPSTISPHDLKSLLDVGQCCLLDVREPVEHAEEHIVSARSVPLGQLEQRVGEVDSAKPVVVMCLGGKRGEQARVKLQRLGFASVRNLEGGLLAWKAAGLPVHRESTGVLPLMRQVQLVAGTATFAGAVLALTIHPLFALIPALSGAGLIINGASGWCGLAILLSRMPWNRMGRNLSCSQS